MAHANELPPELVALEAEAAAFGAYEAIVSPSVLTRLPAPLSLERGECVTSKGVDLHDADTDPGIAWSVLALNSFHDPACAGDPLGYTDETADGKRSITVYWGDPSGKSSSI